MFGCVVAGRLVQTDLKVADETHAYIEIQNSEAINHVCVFLTGTTPFPEGHGATVHLFWPGKGFQLLGMLSNYKPSAIFRLRGAFTSSSSSAHAFSQTPTSMDGGDSIIAILGFSVEPLGDVTSQVSGLSSSSAPSTSAPIRPTDAAAIAERIVKNLMDYISGFAPPGAKGHTTVPLSLIQKWYESLLAKINAGRLGFLERSEE